MLVNKENAEAVLLKIKSKEKVSSEDMFVALRHYESQVNCKSVVSRIKDLIVSQNAGLLGRYIRRGEELPDRSELLSEINLAVTRAINCFDVTRGVKWSTYLCTTLERSTWRAYRKAVSNSSRNCFKESIYGEIIEDKDEPDDDVKYIPAIIKNANLTAAEKEVILGRYLERKKKTLKELSEVFSVSKQSIRNYEKKALNKLRLSLEKIF